MANQNRLSQRYLSELKSNTHELYSQSFEGLLRFLDANSELHEPLGYSVSLKQDAFRLGQTPIMHCHASTFTEVQEQSTIGQYKLKNAHWGLFGVKGALPLHLTEYAIERKYRYQDVTLSEFCDIFHHRFISLFYRSWADAQPTVSHDKPVEKDIFAKRMSVFSGYDPAPTQNQNSANTIHKFLAGLYSMKNRSTGALSQILSEYLQHHVVINEFEGVWYPLPKDAICRLSSTNISLGKDTIIGSSTFQRSFNFSIVVGPLQYQEYIALINNKQHLKMIKQLTTRHVGSEFSFTVKLQLAKGQSRAIKLGQSSLGINSWLEPDFKNQNSRPPSIAYQQAF